MAVTKPLSRNYCQVQSTHCLYTIATQEAQLDDDDHHQ